LGRVWRLFGVNNSVTESPETPVAGRPKNFHLKSVKNRLVCHSFAIDNATYSLMTTTGTTPQLLP